jgi:hypothetical protein
MRIHSRLFATQHSQRFQSRGMATKVGLQLDYYMSAQFAGVACALVDNTYSQKGLSVDFLPICPVGEETARVRAYYHHNQTTVTVGSVEQNIFIPQLYRDPSLNLKAIAAMFYQSPLCLASLNHHSNHNPTAPIGAHEDTVELLQRIVGSSSRVVASPRPTKNTDLAQGTYRAIQAYTTTEVPALQRIHGKTSVQVQELEGWKGTQLGYSQMLFCPTEVLEHSELREVCQSFLEATFDGWAQAIQDPETAVRAVREARAMLGLDDEDNDHWDLESPEYELEFVQRCSAYVKETKVGNKYGVLVDQRFQQASAWLLEPDTKSVPKDFGLDTTALWK